jgi:tetratricopeptide (TPR) repeat protein
MEIMTAKTSTTKPPWTKEQLQQLAVGAITPAELIGLRREHLYQIARVGYQLLNAGKFTDARKVYEGLVAADPYDSVFHCHLAAVYHRLGQLDEAVSQYTEALRYNVANSEALAGRGEIYLACGEVQKGIKDLTTAVRLDTEGKRATTIRARALLFAIRQETEQSSPVVCPPA